MPMITASRGRLGRTTTSPHTSINSPSGSLALTVSPGWRVVGKAQFDINATAGAKATWEHVLKLDPADLEANILLGTIYQRLGDLESSTLALKRALDNKAIGQDQRAEAYALIGRNSKTRWRKEWESKPANERAHPRQSLVRPFTLKCRDAAALPSRLVPQRHRPRAELAPAHELQVDMLR